MSDQRWTITDLRQVMGDVLQAAGLDRAEAEAVAEALAWCEATGRRTQGVWRLPVLLERIAAGGIVSPCNARLEPITDAISVLHGGGGAGHYLVRRAVDEACERAQASGVGIVAVRDSNFCGGLAYFAARAAGRGCAAIIASNSYPKVAAWGGARPIIGTNPFSVAFPQPDGRHFLLDMSTSASAGSTVRKAADEGRLLAESVAIDGAGRVSRDPTAVEHGALLPFGGPKGYGLGLVVEILSGVLTGAAFGAGVKSMYKHVDQPGRNGQFVAVIDVGRLMPATEFFERILQLRGAVERSAADGAAPPRFPGDASWRAYTQAESHGVALEPTARDALQRAAGTYGLPLP